jgi:hypothetical protein
MVKSIFAIAVIDNLSILRAESVNLPAENGTGRTKQHFEIMRSVNLQ